MAGFAIELNNTFQNTFTNVLDDEFNNLKDIHVNKMNIDEIDEIAVILNSLTRYPMALSVNLGLFSLWLKYFTHTLLMTPSLLLVTCSAPGRQCSH